MTKNIKPFFRYFRKRIVFLSVFLTLFLSVFLLSTVFAEKSLEKERKESSNKDLSLISLTFAETIEGKDAHPDIYDWFYGKEGITRKSLEKMFSKDRYQNLNEELLVAVSRDGATITLAGGKTFTSDVLADINNILVMFGIFLAIVTFSYSTFNQMMRMGHHSPHLTLINAFMHLLIVLVLVTEGRNFSLQVVNLGSALTSKIVMEVHSDTDRIEESINKACEALYEKSIEDELDEETYKQEKIEEYKQGRIDEEMDDTHLFAKFTIWLNEKFDSINAGIAYFTYHYGGSVSAFFSCLGLYLGLLVPKFAMFIAGIIVKVLIYSRSLEILILCSLAPIAFGFMSEGGLLNSTGMRYLKNILALSLQGVIIIVILTITQDMMLMFLEADAETFEFTNCVIMSFVEVGMVKKSLEIAQKVVGLS